MSYFNPQNPGIGGLDELTNAEEVFLTSLAGLAYADGDVLYYSGGAMQRLPKGTNGLYLKLVAGLPAWASVSGGASTDDIEMELQFAELLRFTEFIYTGDNLTNKSIYADNTKVTKLFNVDYTYSGDDLSTVVVTRISDSASYTKTYAYSGGSLQSIDVV